MVLEFSFKYAEDFPIFVIASSPCLVDGCIAQGARSSQGQVPAVDKAINLCVYSRHMDSLAIERGSLGKAQVKPQGSHQKN